MRIALLVKLAIKATDNSDMYNRAFPVGNALLFFAGGMMSLFRLPCGKLSLSFLAVPAGKDGWVLTAKPLRAFCPERFCVSSIYAEWS